MDFIKKLDPTIIITIGLLCVLGIITLISANLDASGNIVLAGTVQKQLIFMVVGFIAFLAVSRLDYTYLKHPQIFMVIYIVAILLLVATLLFGPTINNVKRWLVFGGFYFQPSELAKIAVIIFSAGLLNMRDRYNELLLFAVSAVLLLPIFALIYMQPNGSMSAITLAIWFLLMFTFVSEQLRNTFLLTIIATMSLSGWFFSIGNLLAGTLLAIAGVIIFILSFFSREQWRKLFILALAIGFAGGIVTSLTWSYVLRDYQKDRIVAFVDPASADGANVAAVKNHITQSKIAIGSGGFTGKGFGAGTQTRLRFLPEHETDFIFATYAEQFGLVGSLFLIALYLILIVRMLLAAMFVEKRLFGAMLLTGFAIKLFIEIFINLGTNTGIIPATGIPLPFMSAGGSITIITFIMLGIAQSIIMRQNVDPKEGDMVDSSGIII